MSQKIKTIQVTNLFFEDLFKKKELHLRMENPLPKDAKLVNSHYDPDRNLWFLLFESAEFEPIMEVQMLPRHDVIITDLIAKKSLEE